MGAESLSRRRIAVNASGRDNKHVSLRDLNPVKVRAEANSPLRLPVREQARRRRRPHLPLAPLQPCFDYQLDICAPSPRDFFGGTSNFSEFYRHAHETRSNHGTVCYFTDKPATIESAITLRHAEVSVRAF
jgi:hypothetical protein